MENMELRMPAAIDSTFWQGKKVFLTGHTGFKGGWLAIWLGSMGAIVKGYALCPVTKFNLFEIANVERLLESEINDIRDYPALSASISAFSPDIVFHMAAQPLVRASYRDPLETFSTNVMGTVNLLDAARHCSSIKAVINITTDKCYENDERLHGYLESDPMGGRDPYSSSKGCAELVSSAYRESFFNSADVGLATVRAGNVIGGGDWAEDRLIPDILRAFDENQEVVIRNPKATRPWQHVLEPLSGYLTLAAHLYNEPNKFSGGWNFGPEDDGERSVEWILTRMVKLWPGASWKLDMSDNPHEAMLLKLNIAKAAEFLGWTPTWTLDKTLTKIVRWHQHWNAGSDMQSACVSEIDEFIKDVKHGSN